MKRLFLSLAMLLGIMASSAQNEVYVGDMNEDGNINIADVTQLVNTVIGRQAPRKVSLGGGDPYAVDNSAIAGTWRTTSGEVITFNADGGCTINNTAYTFEYMPQLGFIAVYDSNGECPLSYNVLKKTKDMLLLNTMAQTGGKFYYTSAMFVTAIKLSSTSVNLNTGQKHQLTATVTPANAKVPTLKWTSSSTGIATVDQTGLVTAKSRGKATITATSTDGTGVKATCTFNITQLVTSVTLPYTTLNIGLEDFFALSATVSPSTADDKTLVWTSSSESNVMSLGGGKIYAKAAGTSTITAAATDGSGKKATCKVTVLSAAPTGVSLSAKSLSIKPSESAQLTATVTPSGASTATVIWTSSDPSVATVDKTGKVTATSTEGEAVITATVVGSTGLTALATVKVKSAPSHEYVDLGLPSGTLWATMNVGAESPEDYGNYYAWGETKAYGEEDASNSHNYSYNGNSSYKKTYYAWSTYKYASGTDWKSVNKYTFKDGQTSGSWYSGSTFIGDNKKVLDLADDAAYVNWGDEWRMPTHAEMQELVSGCTWSWTTVNGVYGRKGVSKTNSNSIFLPAAGYRSYGSLNYDGSNGYYWSSSLYESYSDYAWNLYFGSGSISAGYYYYRCYGQSVRAVRRQ